MAEPAPDVLVLLLPRMRGQEAARRVLAAAGHGEDARLDRTPLGQLVAAVDGVEAHLSVAHAADLTLAAASTAGPIGVDLELVRDVRALEAVATRWLWPEAAAAVAAAPEDARPAELLAHWTALEAALKRDGLGLPSLDGRDVEPPTLVQALAQLPAGYVGALASTTPDPRIALLDERIAAGADAGWPQPQAPERR